MTRILWISVLFGVELAAIGLFMLALAVFAALAMGA